MLLLLLLLVVPLWAARRKDEATMSPVRNVIWAVRMTNRHRDRRRE